MKGIIDQTIRWTEYEIQRAERPIEILQEALSTVQAHKRATRVMGRKVNTIDDPDCSFVLVLNSGTKFQVVAWGEDKAWLEGMVAALLPLVCEEDR